MKLTLASWVIVVCVMATSLAIPIDLDNSELDVSEDVETASTLATTLPTVELTTPNTPSIEKTTQSTELITTSLSEPLLNNAIDVPANQFDKQIDLIQNYYQPEVMPDELQYFKRSKKSHAPDSYCQPEPIQCGAIDSYAAPSGQLYAQSPSYEEQHYGHEEQNYEVGSPYGYDYSAQASYHLPSHQLSYGPPSYGQHQISYSAPIQQYQPQPAYHAPPPSYHSAPVYHQSPVYYAPPPPPPPVYQSYSYASPAPQTQCGSNLLFGCSPQVSHVPCSGYGGQQQYPIQSYGAPQTTIDYLGAPGYARSEPDDATKDSAKTNAKTYTDVQINEDQLKQISAVAKTKSNQMKIDSTTPQPPPAPSSRSSSSKIEAIDDDGSNKSMESKKNTDKDDTTMKKQQTMMKMAQLFNMKEQQQQQQQVATQRQQQPPTPPQQQQQQWRQQRRQKHR